MSEPTMETLARRLDRVERENRWLKRAGLVDAQSLLGHKDIRMTVRYSHLPQDHLQETVNLLDQNPVPQQETGIVQGMATSWLPENLQG